MLYVESSDPAKQAQSTEYVFYVRALSFLTDFGRIFQSGANAGDAQSMFMLGQACIPFSRSLIPS